jgi:hypothetical protein
MQYEMQSKGLKREEISSTKAVLYGATAGYAVSSFSLPFLFIIHGVTDFFFG